jgi:hypothetical protein
MVSPIREGLHMTWLVLLIALVALAIIAISLSNRRQSGSAATDLPAESPALTPPPSPVAVSSPRPGLREHGHMLQPFSPIPLTLEDASPGAVATLRDILVDDRGYGRERQERILEWLLTTNARVKEIDSFIAEWGPKYRSVVQEISEADPDWPTAGELDRKDILGGARKRAVERLDVRVADLDYEAIAEPPSLVATADDELLARYGFATISFYFRHVEDLGRVHLVPSDEWYRPRFEALVSKGLARRGVDVPPEGVLQTLTLKEMEALAEGVEHKRFTRRAPAVEFLSSLSDLRDRLGRHVPLRGLFQLAPLPEEFAHLDIAALGHAWAFAAEYVKLLEATYSTASQAQQAMTDAASDEYARGWRVEAMFGDEACCPLCARQVGEHRGVRKAPRLPHHVGCRCHLSQIYE